MMTGAYGELYLDDARNNLGDMVEYAVCDLGMDPDVFFGYFISSGIAAQFEKGNPKYISGLSGYELTWAVLNAVHALYEKKEPSHVSLQGREYWAGWILAYYQWKTGRRFEDMVQDGLTLSRVLSLYILHEADDSRFVTAADEILAAGKANRKSRLSEIRSARGFTQRELSEASGVTLRMIQLYEQRQNDIGKAQVNVVLRLARALGCAVEDLVE